MIELLNTYFVPVYTSNEDYRHGGCALDDEKAECRRIYLEALNSKLPAGTVHAYVTAPDGHTIDSQHVANAAKVEELTKMLERTVERLKTTAGQPLVQALPQSRPPEAEPGSLVLHLTARNLMRQGDDFVPHRTVLGETRSANWGSYAAENWVVLGPDECRKLLPPGAGGQAGTAERTVRSDRIHAVPPGGIPRGPDESGNYERGTTWDLDPDVAARFLTHFYPSTENNDVSKNRIDDQTLRATVLSADDRVVRARLDGSLRMKHTFYHRDDGNFVDATLVGIIEFEPAAARIRSLQLVTSKAVYGANKTVFGVALRSVP